MNWTENKQTDIPPVEKDTRSDYEITAQKVIFLHDITGGAQLPKDFYSIPLTDNECKNLSRVTIWPYSEIRIKFNNRRKV